MPGNVPDCLKGSQLVQLKGEFPTAFEDKSRIASKTYLLYKQVVIFSMGAIFSFPLHLLRGDL
jgi:hypothetical protein